MTVPNRAPLVAKPLPDGEALAGDALVTRVSGHFTDPDGDDLSFAAASSSEVAIGFSLMTVQLVSAEAMTCSAWRWCGVAMRTASRAA